MKIEVANISKTFLNGARALKNAAVPIRHLSSLQQYFPAIQVTKLLLVVLLFGSACNDKDGQAGKGQSTKQPDIKFDRTKWNVKNNGNYTYRKQMVNDLLDNYQWAGVKKDSVIQMLGQPDGIEEGNLIYDYEKKPFLGGLGTIIEAVVFELEPDSTVKVARLNDGGWD
jgi:hypothetical protein